MKASELINKLQIAIEKYGDMEMLIHCPVDGWSATEIDVVPDPPSEIEKELGVAGTIDIVFWEDDETISQRNDVLYDLLNAHYGHKVEIAIYGDADCPVSVTLEDMDTNTVIFDATQYTIKERTDI